MVFDPKKASFRFENTAKTAHHSIVDHVRVEILLEGVFKMTAIVEKFVMVFAGMY